MSGYHLVYRESDLPREVPLVESYACLSDTSESGLKWRSGEIILTLTFGSCTENYRAWPPDVAERYKDLHVFPLNYQCHIQTGWNINKLGSCWEVERVMEWVPAAAVREHLQVRAEIEREIKLLSEIVARGRR